MKVLSQSNQDQMTERDRIVGLGGCEIEGAGVCMVLPEHMPCSDHTHPQLNIKRRASFGDHQSKHSPKAQTFKF